MEISRGLSGEKLPRDDTNLQDSEGRPELLTQDLKNMSDEEITQKIETILLERVKAGDNQALFQLGQLYFEQVRLYINVHVLVVFIFKNKII